MPKRSTLGAHANIYTTIVTNAFDLGMTKNEVFGMILLTYSGH
jgi:hypothetical protein